MSLDRPNAASHLRMVRFLIPAMFVALLNAPLAHAQLLFQDDFSSGDFSNHNDFFRWGRDGNIPRAGETFGGILYRITGPTGSPVNAIRLQYGTWQEVGFHLTKSRSEARTANGTSAVVYPITWFSYWLYVPGNYAHGPTDPSNNKGFLTVWKDAYISNQAQWAFDWVRQDSRDSRLRAWGAANRDTPQFIRTDHQIPGATHYPYAFVPGKDYGRWIHVAMGAKMASAPGIADGYIKLYKDGQLVADWQNLANHVPAPLSGYDRGYIFGYHNSGYSETTTFYITGFKFGTSESAVRVSEVAAPRPPAAVSVQ